MKGGLKTSGKLRRLVRDEVGGAVAEIAIMVPFLAIMLAGVTEFGRFFQTYTTLAKATRGAARYLSNRELPITGADMDTAENLVVCGKLTCAGGDELVSGMTAANVCIEEPTTNNVRVSIPRSATTCANDVAPRTPHVYQPIFDIGALLHSDTFSLELPVSPSTTMYYLTEPPAE